MRSLLTIALGGLLLLGPSTLTSTLAAPGHGSGGGRSGGGHSSGGGGGGQIHSGGSSNFHFNQGGGGGNAFRSNSGGGGGNALQVNPGLGGGNAFRVNPGNGGGNAFRVNPGGGSGNALNLNLGAGNTLRLPNTGQSFRTNSNAGGQQIRIGGNSNFNLGNSGNQFHGHGNGQNHHQHNANNFINHNFGADAALHAANKLNLSNPALQHIHQVPNLGGINHDSHHHWSNNNLGNINWQNHNGYNNSFYHYHPNHWKNNSYFFGIGSPFSGYLNYPWYNNGLGYSWYRYRTYYPWFTYGTSWGLGSCGLGIGLGYGFGYPYYMYQPGLSYTNYYNTYGYTQPATAVAPLATTVVANQPVVADMDESEHLADAIDFAGRAEELFKAAKYQNAIRNWQHALVDDPRNGAIVLLLSQALFALGQYQEAAGATQQGMMMLPEDKWGAVIENYTQIYPNIQLYTDQLKALEAAAKEKPDDAALRFLLGYHYGYLKYPKQSVRELRKCLAIAPKDELAAKLLDQMMAKLSPEDAAALNAAANVAPPAPEETGPGTPAGAEVTPPQP